MNRKSKVIVSIVGITIVLLALLGITYAYYLTRIEGNTNTNSISITTANLRLVYRDGTPNILTATNIQPSKTEFYTKTFTVTNEGNATIDDDILLRFVNALDVQSVCKDVFGHRVKLSAKARTEGMTMEEAIKELIKSVEAPRN